MKDSVTRLLYVVEQVQPSRQYLGLFQYFVKHNVQITVFNLQEGPEFRAQLESSVENYHFLSSGNAYWRSIKQLSKLVNNLKPDVIHCQEFIASFYFGFVPKPKGSKSIYHRRHNYTSGFVPKVMDQWAVMRSDRVVTVCNKMQKVAQAEHPLFSKKIISKTNAITLGLVHQETLDSELELIERLPEKFSLMLLSRLRKGKGHIVAIKVTQKLLESGKDVQLLFVGEGEEEVNLKNKITDMGMESKVHFLGNFENIDVAIKKANVLLVPSDMEAFPKTPLEGMAYGSPVIAHEVGGIVESIENGVNGFLVKKGDVNAFVLYIEQLMSNPKLRQSIIDQGIKTVQKRYVVEIMAQEFIDLYQELKNGSRKSRYK
ncbi:glycosyltransferase family 4 protein [Salibacteraceae bacterium]|nr:hypothetical protein [Crocinitomicaceae bacterium]MAZ37476.1 hypothetical protein [Crocinitomicaceae bacterium]MDC1205044.1 glycosyltransferase family 4 protein [Salibacteraceae bacterium]|tara:strand:+ start:1335 stop:2453 length:1119 start_codon:yes stop_codon:yes gene_type:complete